MIISASRRTDIPAFYSQWFFNRIKEGYVLVPNPYHPKMISKISLSPAVVDCFVFWTKNPAPMLNQLEKLQDYNYYFQFTLNPYGEKLENHLPSIDKRMDTFKKLADKIGRERVIWRYDPILRNEEYNVSFHQEAFARIAHELKDHTSKCMLGFIDHYPHIRNSIQPFNINPLTKGHTLVVPKMEVDYIFDLDDQTLAGMMLFAKKVAGKIKQEIACSRVAVVVLGLEVPHAHIHLIPINEEEDVDFKREKLKMNPEEFRKIADELRLAD